MGGVDTRLHELQRWPSSTSRFEQITDIFYIHLGDYIVDEVSGDSPSEDERSGGCLSPNAAATPKLTSAESANLMDGEEIIHGEPLTDRKSTFQAHVTEVHSVNQVPCGGRSLI